MNTQKVYTFPDRKLFGEFDLIEFAELKIKIVNGEISQQLCLIDSKDTVYCFDEFAQLDGTSDEFLDDRYSNILLKLIGHQCDKRKTINESKITNIDSKSIDELLPFEVNTSLDEAIAQSHGINPEEMESIFTGFIQEQNSQIRLSDMEVGRKLTIAAIRRNYSTTKGPRDLIIFARMQNIGKPNGEMYNQIQSNLLKLEIVEVGEVTDNYFDFMNNLKKLNNKI